MGTDQGHEPEAESSDTAPSPMLPEVVANLADAADHDDLTEDDFSSTASASLEIEPPAEVAAAARDLADEDAVDASLAAAVSGESELVGGDAAEVDAENELSPQRLYLELKRIEDEVKALIEPRDPVRKRRLGGTRRWRELEEDLIQWRFGDRFDEPTLQRVQCLIARRHQLYQRLRFLAATRPSWNT